jgi:high-affinity Fe2+/Pb2+ permease
MTENKALWLDAVVGCTVTWGVVYLLGAIGAAERFQAVAVGLGLTVPTFLVGVIGAHYQRKEEEEGKDQDER